MNKASAHGTRKLEPGQRVVITGAAGFIGSHLAERLLTDGFTVVGIDCFTDFYPRALKQANLERLFTYERFAFHDLDLSCDSCEDVLTGADVVFHLAAQAGVRTSFGAGFETYVRHNVTATQHLLEAAIVRKPLNFVFASSSSIYGDAPDGPTAERARRHPISPYGVTKVTTEDLAAVYHRSWGLPTVGLRYFTVYGPRQRPDMAFTRFLSCALHDEPLQIIGDGNQIRDFTFIDDIVDGTIAAAEYGRPGRIYNIGGGNPVRVNEAVELIAELVGHEVKVIHLPVGPGESSMTASDTTRARAELDWVPRRTLREGLKAHLDWILATEAAAPDLSESTA